MHRHCFARFDNKTFFMTSYGNYSPVCLDCRQNGYGCNSGPTPFNGRQIIDKFGVPTMQCSTRERMRSIYDPGVQASQDQTTCDTIPCVDQRYLYSSLINDPFRMEPYQQLSFDAYGMPKNSHEVNCAERNYDAYGHYLLP